jgi:hypothetical protein
MKDMPASPSIAKPAHWPYALRNAIALWATWSIVVIGGIGAMYAGSEIKNANRRASIAQRGVFVSGTISGRGSPIFSNRRGCGRGMWAVIRFTTREGKIRNECVSYADLPGSYIRFAFLDPPNEAKVDVAYDPNDQRYFFIAPNNVVPQRDVSGVWRRWALQTFWLLAFFIPTTSFVLYRQRRLKTA